MFFVIKIALFVIFDMYQKCHFWHFLTPNWPFLVHFCHNPTTFMSFSPHTPPLPNPPLAPWGDPTLCRRGETCDYAHTQEEVMYHPEKYKTTPCQNFRRLGACKWKSQCAYRHGDDDVDAPASAAAAAAQQQQQRSSADAKANWWLGELERVPMGVLRLLTVDEMLVGGEKAVDRARMMAYGLPEWYREAVKKGEVELAGRIEEALGWEEEEEEDGTRWVYR